MRIGKVGYWLISLCIILILFFLIFGVMGVYIYESKVQPEKIIGPLVSLVGLSIFLASFDWTATLFRPMLPKSTADALSDADLIVPRLLGSAILLGGILYTQSGNVDTLIGGWVAGVILSWLRTLWTQSNLEA